MDHYQRNMDDDYSIITYNQPLNSMSFISSTPSIVDSTSKTVKHTRTIIERKKQEARPLGTCVRKCVQCRQLKHILLAECTVCFRMMDVDLKDCKCQILTNKNIIEHFICSICNSELTLDGYIICANRTCQTTLSALINNESTDDTEERSSLSTVLTNICYPKSAYRTVAVQINTLNNLPLLQCFEPIISSWSKDDSNRTIVISSGSSGTSNLSMDTAADASLNDISRNMTVAFNSNQPSKLALQSEDETQQTQEKPSTIHTLTTTTDISINNSPEFTEIPKSPRCLAIMNARKRRNRLSILLTLSTNKTCQTQLSCLAEIDKMVEYQELSDVTVIRTHNSNKMERQIQVDTIKGHFDDLCQVQIEISDLNEKDSTSGLMNDERVLRALTDRDGQRWSELIDQLINEQSSISPSEKAQELLDTIERLHSTGKLNSLTTGQLQRKVRYAMSQFKHFDERSYLQNQLKKTKKTRSGTTPVRNSECNGRVDMSVTVRQVDKPSNRQTEASSDQNWKPYVDRLFEQGLSADEIQRLLHEAAKTSMLNDDQRLQDVFNYINIKANQQRTITTPAPSKTTPAKTAKGSGGIMTRSSPSVSERKGKSNESSPHLNNKDQDLTTAITKNKSNSPNNNLPKSNMIQPQPLEKMSIIDFNEDQIEPNVSVHSSPDQEYKDTVAHPNAPIIDKKQSINSAEITIKRETSNEKKSTSDIIALNLEQKTNQVPQITESKIPEISSSIGITPSSGTPVTELEEKCIDALHDVQNSLDDIHNTNIRVDSHPSNTQSELNKLINAFESYLHKSNNIDGDNIESLMAQCIEHLNNEKETVRPRLEESQFRNLAEKISNTLNLLQEYKKIVIPIKTDHEDSSFNQHISNMITVSVDPSVSSNQVQQNVGQTIESQSLPKSNLDLKQQIDTSDYQDPEEQLASNESDVQHTPADKPPQTESNSDSDQSQIAWLGSLFSKMSSDVSNTSDVVSTSPSLSVTNPVKVDLNDDLHDEERKVPEFSNGSRSSVSIDQQTKNTPSTTNDSRSILYETDVIKLEEEEHATSIIVPDQELSMLDEQFQVVQTKISHLSNLDGQVAPIQNNVPDDNSQKELSNSNYDSNETSPSITTSHENNIDPKKQSPSLDNNDQPQSMTIPSPCHSNVDLSEQLLVSTSEDNFELLQKQLNSDNDENTSFELVPEYMSPSKTGSNTDPMTSTKLSFSNDQENEEKNSASILSYSSDENKNQDMMKMNEPSVHIEETPDSSQSDIQPVDRHVSQATSQTMSRQNDTNKLRLPISAQHINVPNSIKSTSLLTDLHDQDDTNSSKKSISSDNPPSDVQEHSSAQISPSNSENQNITGTSTQNDDDDKQSLNEKIDNMANVVVHAPIMLPPNIMLSPLQNPKTEDNKYKKLTTPTSFQLKPTLPKEIELASKHDSIPRLFIEEPSGSATPSIHAAIADDDHADKKPDTSMSSTQKTPIDNKLDRDNDKLINEENLSKPETSSLDDTIRIPPLPFKNIDSLATEITNKQQPKILPTTNKRYSRPKIFVEDIQSPPVLTPHTSPLTMVPDDDTQEKSKPSSPIVDGEKQLNKTLGHSYLEEKSSSNEARENTVASEIVNHVYDAKSEENPSIHSSPRSEQSQHEEDDPSKRYHSPRIESLIKLLPSPPNKQSMDDNHSETEDILDQNLPSYITDDENSSEGELVNQKPFYLDQLLSPMTLPSIMTGVKWPSSIVTKKSPMISAIPTVLPSPVANIKMQQQKLKSQLTSLESKNGKSTSDLISVSSFNLAHLNDLTPSNHRETEDKYSFPQSEKNLSDVTPPRPIKSKQPSSSTNSLVLSGMPSSSIPKLLLKRSSIKQPSTIVSSTKPNTTLSITDVSTSSSNTIATDHLLTTHSTISDHEEIIPLNKTNKKLNSKNGFIATSESNSKRNILRKTSRPSQNRSFVSENRKEPRVKTSKKKLTNNNLIKSSEPLIDETEPWIKSHDDDISQIFTKNEQDEKKQNKNRTVNRSRISPFKLKAQSDHYQTDTFDSSRLPNIQQTSGEHHLKKLSNDPFRRPIIRLPVTQIEKFECGTIGPHLHPSSVAHQILCLPSIRDRPQFPTEINGVTESFTDRLYSLLSPEHNTDEQAFESIIHWQDHQHLPKIEQNKYQYMYVLDTSTENSVRGKQYPILTDEIDMIDDPYACTIVNKWAFADLVNDEREKCIRQSIDKTTKSNPNKRIQICLRKRPLTSFEVDVLKEVDIISVIDPQTLLLHIPSITVDNQVFIKNRKFKCDQTFDEHCPMNTIYHSTLAPLLNKAIDGNKCLYLIGGGKYSGKTYLLRSLVDLLASDLNQFLSTYDICIKLLGICHNRIVDILQNYSPIRLMKSRNWTLIPNVEFPVKNDDDLDYVVCQIKKRRRFMHQLIEIHFREKNQSITIGSLMIVILVSSQYVYTRNLCSHRRKFLINSLNKTILSFKRALLGIRKNPDRIRAAFNNDILTRLIQPYVFHGQSNICYIGTLNPGHRHRIATKSTLEFARNLRFCLKRINKKRRQRKNPMSFNE